MIFWIFRRPMSSILEGGGNKERKRRNAICDAVQKTSAMSTGKSEWKRNGTEWNNYDESAISLNWKVFGSDLICSVGIRRYIEMAVCTLYLCHVHIHLISCIFIDAVDTWRRVAKWSTRRGTARHEGGQAHRWGMRVKKPTAMPTIKCEQELNWK